MVTLFTSDLPFLPGHQIHPRSAHAQSNYFGVAPDQTTAPLEPWQEVLGDLRDQVLSYRDTKQIEKNFFSVLEMPRYFQNFLVLEVRNCSSNILSLFFLSTQVKKRVNMTARFSTV